MYTEFVLNAYFTFIFFASRGDLSLAPLFLKLFVEDVCEDNGDENVCFGNDLLPFFFSDFLDEFVTLLVCIPI